MSTRGDIFRVCAELSDSEVDIQTSENNGKLDYAELVIRTKEQVSKKSKLYIKEKDVTFYMK